MRYLLDTNVVSDATKATRSKLLTAWMSARHNDELFISSLTLAEIRRGILGLPVGRKRREFEVWFEGPDGPRETYRGQILPFDERAAMVWAELIAQGEALGRPRSPLDMIIAATALANDCVIVTGNERHFWGFNLVNPLR